MIFVYGMTMKTVMHENGKQADMSQLVSSLDGQTAMENDSFLIQSKCDDYQKLRLLSLLQCAMDCFFANCDSFFITKSGTVYWQLQEIP